MNKISEEKFQSLIARANVIFLDRPDHLAGYLRGLRRAYHGESFGDPGEHERWLSLSDRSGHTSQERGSGYVAGIAALDVPEKRLAPTSTAVHAFLQHHSITGSQAARMMYLSDSRQVRKYTGGASPRQMDGARWFALHAHVLLSPEQIAEIELAMEADCQGA